MDNYNNQNSNIIGNFGAGVLFGLVVGLLIAPRKGEETRENLMNAANSALDRIKTEPARVRDQIENTATDLRDRLEENVNNVKEKITDQAEELRSGLESDAKEAKGKLNETKEKIEKEANKKN